MERRTKVELFEQIRREYAFGEGTVQGAVRKFGVHRRLVRQALQSAVPPSRRLASRARPCIAPLQGFIDEILESDRQAPRKQRHTAHRIWVRVQQELGAPVAESTVRHYVRERKAQLHMLEANQRAIFVPQSYGPGQEAQVDWYEACADVAGERLTLQVFSMRAMFSGAAFHFAFTHATQQAFLEAHELAFAYFGGVFHCLRYDNLTSAVKRILRGHQREQNERFITFRSHWGFTAQFCNPAAGHEKGGVEGEVGFFRRNHWVPVPQSENMAARNEGLRQACLHDQQRRIGERTQSVGALLWQEKDHLLPLAAEGFDLSEVTFAVVDGQGCVKVRTNRYSTPLRVGSRVQVKVRAGQVEIWQEGRLAAKHQRCYGRGRQILELEHYRDVLSHKPGAFAGSIPLVQWREKGRWPRSFDQLWQSLQARHGVSEGTREMIGLLLLGRRCGYERLRDTIETALELGCTDAAAVRYLLNQSALQRTSVEPLSAAVLQELHLLPAHAQRPLPEMNSYDQLLRRPLCGEPGPELADQTQVLLTEVAA